MRRDFEQVLRAMQRATDRQKTLAAFGSLLSDERLQMAPIDLADRTSVAGRVLVHSEEDVSGARYLMLEGTDARIHNVHYTPEIEVARSQGYLRVNSFVRLRKLSSDDNVGFDVEDLGDSEAILRNKHHLRATARQMLQRGAVPQDDGWGGWLGRYQDAVRKAAIEVEQHPKEHFERRKNRGLGR